ncbi:hypothetical protein DEJ31_02655 [Curtobacterium sp. MCPF17_031]|nr:hypothetical protein DEJ31_02655 [Curtobacterium sp. MCPF17_031]
MRAGDNDALSFWRDQARAVTLVRDCDAAVQAMERAGIEVRGLAYYVDEWYAAAFSENLGWRAGANGASAPIGKSALLALHQLSPWMARNWGGSVTAAQRHDFSRVLKELDDLMAEVGADLTEDERSYVLKLLSAARALLEERSVLSDSDLRDHLDVLNGALLRAAGSLSTAGKMDKAKKLLDVVGQLVVIAGGLATTGQTALDAGKAFLHAIGGA